MTDSAEPASPDGQRSLSFDQGVDSYDGARGGMTRGRSIACNLEAYLGVDRTANNGVLLDAGTGTGVVAAALAERGWQVIGCDIGHRVLKRARERGVTRLVRGDVEQLPFCSRSVAAVVAIWLLHVVGDRERTLCELARVMRDDAVLIYIPSRPTEPQSDVDQVLYRLGIELRDGEPHRDRLDEVARLAQIAGLTEQARFRVDVGLNRVSPVRAAQQLVDRVWSPLWSLKDDRWARIVEPAIQELLSLPENDDPRGDRELYDGIILVKPSRQA